MLTGTERRRLIDTMRRLPDDLAACVAGLTANQMTTPYMQGEWTVAQNVHHVADSHMNAYVRMKLILTEEHPTLKPYDQNVWADMVDATPADVADSLHIIRGLHRRWVAMLNSLDVDHDARWQRTAFHPEIGEVTLDDLLAIYGDHGHGHIDQIQRTLAAAK
jgi:hypothetical protein